MKAQRNRTYDLRITGVHGQIGGDVPPPPPPPSPGLTADDIQRLQFERETAAAEAARVKRELEELRGKVPTDEERAKWRELEEKERQAEEKRLQDSGQFEAWRKSIQDTHTRELSELRGQVELASQRATSVETELNDSLIAQCFAAAVDLFGPAGYTTMLPEMAQSYLGKHVYVTVGTDNSGKTVRRVVVRDASGVDIMDPATGKPEVFSKAMKQVIDKHPYRQHMLRGSGKVGANNSGGAGDGESGVNLDRLKPADFKKKEVRDAIRNRMNNSGGLQIGPGFEQLKRSTER